MKRISISLMGLFLAALPGCGAEFVSRPIVWQDAQFLPTLPCQPETDSDGATVDHTEFGVLRGQTHGCKDTWRNVSYVVTTGVFESRSSERMSEGRKKRQDAAIAVEFARQLCEGMRQKEEMYCIPRAPVEVGHVTEVGISFGNRLYEFPGRVKVSYPYIAGVLVIGRYISKDEIRSALDIQLPKP